MSKIIEIQKIIEIETEELDYAFNNELSKDGEIIYKGEETNFLDEFPIKIEELEKYIERIKKTGCNYISIGYHVDHYTYLLQGYNVK